MINSDIISGIIPNSNKKQRLDNNFLMSTLLQLKHTMFVEDKFAMVMGYQIRRLEIHTVHEYKGYVCIPVSTILSSGTLSLANHAESELNNHFIH